MSSERNLTDADVEAVVVRLKSQIMNDFQMSVGKGLLGWIWTWFWRLLILAAIYGVVRGQLIPDKPSTKLGAAIVPRPAASFTVIPSYRTPADMLAMAGELDRRNGGKQ